jgi:hypothetical protein
MRTHSIRWRLLQADIDHLSKELRPIRSCREVGKILGFSASLVSELEKSALRKISSALARLEQNLNLTTKTNPTDE